MILGLFFLFLYEVFIYVNVLKKFFQEYEVRLFRFNKFCGGVMEYVFVEEIVGLQKKKFVRNYFFFGLLLRNKDVDNEEFIKRNVGDFVIVSYLI